LIGDQLFTDVWGARRASGSEHSRPPINPKEEIQIVLKRRFLENRSLIVRCARTFRPMRGTRAEPKKTLKNKRPYYMILQ
jgi:predicted HAD superfamily phosphohydrolase YqeG